MHGSVRSEFAALYFDEGAKPDLEPKPNPYPNPSPSPNPTLTKVPRPGVPPCLLWWRLQA